MDETIITHRSPMGSHPNGLHVMKRLQNVQKTKADWQGSDINILRHSMYNIH